MFAGALLIPKFARKCAAMACKLRNRDTSRSIEPELGDRPFYGWSRGSDPVAAVFDFSIGVRPKPYPATAESCRCHRPAGALGPAIVNFGRVRRPVARGRDNSSLVWGGITPYNLP